MVELLKSGTTVDLCAIAQRVCVAYGNVGRVCCTKFHFVVMCRIGLAVELIEQAAHELLLLHPV